MQVALGNTRGYRPMIPLPHYDVKLLKVGPGGVLGREEGRKGPPHPRTSRD
jgi:hypothetical protein